MTRKKFIKLIMSLGYQRNFANKAANRIKNSKPHYYVISIYELIWLTFEPFDFYRSQIDANKIQNKLEL